LARTHDESFYIYNQTWQKAKQGSGVSCSALQIQLNSTRVTNESLTRI